jgi:chemotaxis protein methyltransferase CheR
MFRDSSDRRYCIENIEIFSWGTVVTPTDYDFIRKVLKERSGYVLSPDKQYLIDSRLTPLARQEGCATLDDLVMKMRRPGAEALLARVTETMTINESFFFRDKIPFDRFKDTILPAVMEARRAQRRLRIWCSACSTGQEPYSLAMLLRSMREKLAGWQIDIVATDISSDVLDRARAGIYSQFEVQRGLPIQMLMQFFQQVGEQWRVSEEIRRMVQFRQLNLLERFTMLGTFDVVFCRNVLIYFDQPTKSDVLDRICHQLAPQGFLVLGAAETVVGLSECFKPHADKRGLYVRAGGALAVKPASALVPAATLPPAAAKVSV